MRRHIFLSVTLLMVVWSMAPLRAASSPATVSPGSHREVIRVEARCPAFSWGAVEGAGGYELVVYRLPASDQDVGGGELSDVEGGLMEAEAALRLAFRDLEALLAPQTFGPLRARGKTLFSEKPSDLAIPIAAVPQRQLGHPVHELPLVGTWRSTVALC